MSVPAKLQELAENDVPACLRSDFYFDFKTYPFAHEDLLASCNNVVDVLGAVHNYAEQWLAEAAQSRPSRRIPLAELVSQANIRGKMDMLVSVPMVAEEENDDSIIFEPSTVIGATKASGVGSEERVLMLGVCVEVLGGTIDLRKGSVWLGDGVCIEPGAYIAGPAIIGEGTTLRAGAYIRGDAVIGRKVVLRGEVKNAVVMDSAELCHPGYCGDSIIGHAGHFGCQAVTANLGLFGGDLSLPLPTLSPEVTGQQRRIDLGRRKLGVILGDFSQLGCNSVTDPGTFIGPRTHVYPLCRVASGVYGPDEILKNKPAEAGVIVRVPIEPTRSS
mmetsp:Transcript_2480/g.5401  ORF Transcript_2480/g.5401 Transcript_2480/m.5401 type:complete len:331 (-) Transcript_2480:18-1010(-)